MEFLKSEQEHGKRSKMGILQKMIRDSKGNRVEYKETHQNHGPSGWWVGNDNKKDIDQTDLHRSGSIN